MTFRIQKGDHGVLALSNVGRANIVVSYWRWSMAGIRHVLYIKHFLGGVICILIRVINQAFDLLL